MKLLILVPFIAVMVALRLRKAGLLAWIAAWLIGTFVVLRYGFIVPIPMSVLKLYMGVISLACIAYIASDKERQQSFFGPLKALIVDPKYRIQLALVVLITPVAAGGAVYMSESKALEAPTFPRTVHPAPPDSVSAFGNSFDLTALDNPFRELEHTDEAAFGQHLENGRRVYYENCFYCHGDAMGGDGMFAYGLEPIPSNLADPNTISMLQEGFLFWRIAKGAPGLPDEAGPWESAMPAWEKFLTEEEVWDVVLFLYDFTEQRPREREEGHQ